MGGDVGRDPMTSNMELYGREDIPNVPAHVANFRIQILKERNKKLLSVHYTKWDAHLISKITKAIAFWTKLRDGETL